MKWSDGWCDAVLMAEWTPNGDFILRFCTERSGELGLPRLAKINNRETTLSPRWATRDDLCGSLIDGVREVIQRSLARLRYGALGTTILQRRCSTTTVDCSSSPSSWSTATLASTGVVQQPLCTPMQRRCRGAESTRVGSSSASSRSSTTCDSKGMLLFPVPPGTGTPGYRAFGYGWE